MSYSGEGEKRDFSVTELVKPAYQFHLLEQHGDDLEIEAEDMMSRLIGQAFHKFAEDANKGKPNVITERRLSMDIDEHLITGGIDHYEDGVISDYKTITCGGYNERSQAEWSFQLNCYALMHQRAGIPVEKLEVDVVLHDWTKMKSLGHEYPPAKSFVVPVDIWPEDRVISKCRKAIARIKQARAGQIEDCTPHEKWQKPSTHAVWREGNSRATKVFDDPADASEDADRRNAASNDHHYVESRPGEPVRCGYCDARKVCPSFGRYLDVKNNIKSARGENGA
jgi:hypothetical protein